MVLYNKLYDSVGCSDAVTSVCVEKIRLRISLYGLDTLLANNVVLVGS